jgi:hypothetical protein
MRSRKEYGKWMPPKYTVIGRSNYNHEKYPYVNGLKTLREAIDIASSYPILEPNGSCTRIIRNFYFRSLDNPMGVISGMSHEWYVFQDKSLCLASARVPYHVGIDDRFNQVDIPILPSCLDKHRSLKMEMWYLEMIANRLHFTHAHKYMFNKRHESSWSHGAENPQIHRDPPTLATSGGAKLWSLWGFLRRSQPSE